jgi:hypothetical protein
MVALITEHEIHEVPITGALVASFLALTTTWFLLVTPNLTLTTNGAAFGRLAAIHHGWSFPYLGEWRMASDKETRDGSDEIS